MQLETAKAVTNDTWTLSMSTSNELEPGPKSFRKLCAREQMQRLTIPMESRTAQAKAQPVGWGGFNGG
jgi:hypothetical protein